MFTNDIVKIERLQKFEVIEGSIYSVLDCEELPFSLTKRGGEVKRSNFNNDD